MKVLAPVGTLVVAAISCCCCGGDLESLINDLEREVGGGSFSELTVGEDGEDVVDGDDVAEKGGGGGGSTEGLCGTFKDAGMTVPDGVRVVTCATMGGTESVVMQGSADPKASCVPLKDWATGAGWSVTTEASIVGTTSVILKKDGKQLTLACTDQTGQTTVSVSISQAY